MKPINADNRIERSEQFTEKEFGISQKGLPYILHILRSQLYSDKILAVLREYYCNAHDEHVKFNVKRPVEITLPNHFSLEFRVRDFGAGLTEKEVEDIFIKYGESTKRESNDYTGFLGIGCKSGFAYSDSFMIVSYKNGIKTIYNAYLDESQMGKMAILSSEKTKEPNGLEIIIPVRKEDCESFMYKAFDFFKYVRVKPIIKGVEEVPNLERELDAEFCGTDWCKNKQGKSIAIMGNIGYVVNVYSIREKIEDDEASILNLGFDLEFGIGELQMSASRESLEYTDFTIKAIKRKIDLIKSEIPGIFKQKINQAKNLVEAKRFYYCYVRGVYSQICENVEFCWNGKDVTDTRIPVKDIVGDDSIAVVLVEKFTGRNGNFRLTKEYENSINSQVPIMLCDTNEREIISRNKTRLINNNGQDGLVQCLVFKTPSAAIEFEKYTQVSIGGLDKLSNYEKHKRVATAQNGAIENVFLLDYGSLYNYIHPRRYNGRTNKSEIWEASGAEDGIYIELFKYTIKGSKYAKDDESLLGILRNLNSLGVTPNIYGIRKKALDELDEDWVHFDEWFEQKVKEELAKINFEDENDYSLIRNASEFLHFEKIKKYRKGIFGEFFEKLYGERKSKVDEDKLEALRNLASRLSINVEAKKDSEYKWLKNKWKEINIKYPLLSYLCEHNYSSRSPTEKEIISYIEMVDLKNEKN